MNDLLPLDINSLPDLAGMEESSTELGWTYTYERQGFLQGLVRSSTFEGKIRYDLEDIVNDFNGMDHDTFVFILTKLYDNQMDRVSHRGDLSNMGAINKYLKGKVNNDT